MNRTVHYLSIGTANLPTMMKTYSSLSKYSIDPLWIRSCFPICLDALEHTLHVPLGKFDLYKLRYNCEMEPPQPHSQNPEHPKPQT